ncbi:hypothetical protein GE061_016826 [Apolygus lucorum]|uniref:Reverse transcriptase domain-containing protein n=1 Tax=Apolygus lucorum TaxID=248454 RepID=A0A8S9XH87_APOLU|nr:hypothetical protein GE061_016826 [Apolygus lucorum]
MMLAATRTLQSTSSTRQGQPSVDESALRVMISAPLDTPPFTGWTMQQLKDGLKSFGRKKAPGEDAIDFAMLKEAPESYLASLLHLFNHALAEGVFPEKCKVARIKAILKSPERDPSLVSSLRPISLLPCEGKLLERLILNAIEPPLW